MQKDQIDAQFQFLCAERIQMLLQYLEIFDQEGVVDLFDLTKAKYRFNLWNKSPKDQSKIDKIADQFGIKQDRVKHYLSAAIGALARLDLSYKEAKSSYFPEYKSDFDRFRREKSNEISKANIDRIEEFLEGKMMECMQMLNQEI